MHSSIAILTSPKQWFIPYAQKLSRELGSPLFFKHEDIGSDYELVFILSYQRILQSEYLSRHKHNLVIHASKLPQGKGWAPLFWQVLEGKNEVIFTLFEADAKADHGLIYLQDTLQLTGFELYSELRDKQAKLCLKMCYDFLKLYEAKAIKPREQEGAESFYPKRTPKDSELDIHKSIAEQFNLLRIVSNEDFPAFFVIDGHKYYLRISEATGESKE